MRPELVQNRADIEMDRWRNQPVQIRFCIPLHTTPVKVNFSNSKLYVRLVLSNAAVPVVIVAPPPLLNRLLL